MPIAPEVDRMIEFLNELVRIDPVAVATLIDARVPCNSDLAHHPTVQVGLEENFDNPAKYVVGILGVLNGFVGAYDDGPRKGWGAIAAIIETDGTLSGFKKLENVAVKGEDDE